MDYHRLKELPTNRIIEMHKKLKLRKTMDAFLIGIALGLLVFRIARYSFDFMLIIPVLLILIFIRKSMKTKEREHTILQVLEER